MTPNTSTLLTVNQAAELLGLHPQTLYHRIRNKKAPLPVSTGPAHNSNLFTLESVQEALTNPPARKVRVYPKKESFEPIEPTVDDFSKRTIHATCPICKDKYDYTGFSGESTWRNCKKCKAKLERNSHG